MYSVSMSLNVISFFVLLSQLLLSLYICSNTLRTDPLASGQRKRSLPSLPKRPKNYVTVQGIISI